MTKKLTKVAMTTALAAAAIVPAVVATPAQAAEAEVTFAKAYYSTANGTAAFEAGKLAGVISATTDTGITHLEASNGEVFTMQAFSAYLAVNPTATTDQVLTALSKAGKALSADQVKALNVKEGKVEGGKVTVDADAPVADVKVESVKAINVNKIEVTFNKEVDTAKAKFGVKRGTVTEDVTVAWNEAKTVATLTKSGNFSPADYTVTVTGIEDLQNASNTVKIEAEVVKSIEIANGQLQKSATAPLTVNFLNQYGEKATVAANSDVNITAFNTTDSTRTVSQVTNKYELNSSATNVGDKIQVTVIYKGLTATKTLEVVSAAAVNEVVLGEAVLPTGKDKFTQDGTKNVELKYTATNTLGEAYKLKAADIAPTTGQVQFHSSDAQILNTSDISIDADNKIKIAKFGSKAGEVTLTAISTVTGKSSSVTINVQENEGAPYAVTLGKTEASYAANSTDPIYVDFSVTDRYGKAIAAKDVKATDYTFTSDNSTVSDNVVIEEGAGENFGKLKITPKATTKGNSTTITVTVNATGQKATIKLTAADAAVPTVVDQKSTTAAPTSLLVGATNTFTFNVKDQYGTTVTSALPAGYTIDYTTSDAAVLELSAEDKTITTLAVTATAKKAGTATVKAQLKKDGVVVGEKAYTIEVVANTAAGSTYSIDSIDPVYKELLSTQLVTGTGATTVAALTNDTEKEKAVKSGYAEKISVYATNAAGVKTAVPTSALAGAPVITQAKTAGGADTTGKLSVFEYNGNYYVYTSTAFVAGDFVAGSSTEDVKAKITYTVNASDDIKTVSQDITISKADLQAQSVEFKSAAVGTTTATDVTSLTVSDAATYVSATGTAFVWVKDQFGGYSLADTGAEASALVKVVAVSNATGIANDTVTISDAGAISIADGSTDNVFSANNAVVRLIAQVGSLTDFINVTVQKENVAPKATLPAATGDTNNATTLVATFDEALYNTTTAIADGADVKALFTYDGTAGNYTSATYNAANKTVTFVFTAAEDGKKLTASTDIKDANGNAYGAKVYTYANTGTIWTITP